MGKFKSSYLDYIASEKERTVKFLSRAETHQLSHKTASNDQEYRFVRDLVYVHPPITDIYNLIRYTHTGILTYSFPFLTLP